MLPKFGQEKYDDRKEHPLSLQEFLRDDDLVFQSERVAYEVYEEHFDLEEIASFFGCEPEDLTWEETRDFTLYARYAGRRLLLSDVIGTKEEILDQLENHRISIGINMAGHDLAHTLVEYSIRSRGGGLVPGFIGESKATNNREVIEDELYSVLGGKPLMLALLSERDTISLLNFIKTKYANSEHEWIADDIFDAIKYLDHESFGSVVTVYMRIVLALVKAENQGTAKKEGYSEEEMQAVNIKYDQVCDEIVNNPPSELVAIAKKIFEEHETNPKVLIREFLDRAKPLTERLRRKDDRMWEEIRDTAKDK